MIRTAIRFPHITPPPPKTNKFPKTGTTPKKRTLHLPTITFQLLYQFSGKVSMRHNLSKNLVNPMKPPVVIGVLPPPSPPASSGLVRSPGHLRSEAPASRRRILSPLEGRQSETPGVQDFVGPAGACVGTVKAWGGCCRYLKDMCIYKQDICI